MPFPGWDLDFLKRSKLAEHELSSPYASCLLVLRDKLPPGAPVAKISPMSSNQSFFLRWPLCGHSLQQPEKEVNWDKSGIHSALIPPGLSSKGFPWARLSSASL